MFSRIFLDHPRSVGESYGEHRAVALGFAAELMTAGCACLVHAFVPSLCQRTASRTIERLHARMGANRHRLGRSGVEQAGAAVAAQG